MRKKDKYILREKKIPYYQDEVLTRNHGAANGVMPGVSLKVYEVFDGKDVKTQKQAFDRLVRENEFKENAILNNFINQR